MNTRPTLGTPNKQLAQAVRPETPNREVNVPRETTPNDQMGKVELDEATDPSAVCENVLQERSKFESMSYVNDPSAVCENVLQERSKFESMSYVNDLSESDVDYVVKLVEEKLRIGFKRKEISGKWLSKVLMRSNKTLCERYGRGTPVSVIVKAELETKTDDLRDKLLELPPSAREKLLNELAAIKG